MATLYKKQIPASYCARYLAYKYKTIVFYLSFYSFILKAYKYQDILVSFPYTPHTLYCPFVNRGPDVHINNNYTVSPMSNKA